MTACGIPVKKPSRLKSRHGQSEGRRAVGSPTTLRDGASRGGRPERVSELSLSCLCPLPTSASLYAQFRVGC